MKGREDIYSTIEGKVERELNGKGDNIEKTLKKEYLNEENQKTPATYHGKGLKGLENNIVEGKILINSQPISFFGDFDINTGICINPEHDIVEMSIEDSILVFPSGAGSTVGSYSIINLALNEKALRAIIVNRSDPVLLIGCAIASIPHIHRRR